MSPGSSTESYPAFAHLGLRENPGKNLNQVTCPDRESNPGHLVSRPDALTVTPQVQRRFRREYQLRPSDDVSTYVTIMKWDRCLRETGVHMKRRDTSLLIVIRPSDGDVKFGGPLGAIRQLLGYVPTPGGLQIENGSQSCHLSAICETRIIYLRVGTKHKNYNGWGDHRANHTIPPFWLDDRPPLLRHVGVRPAAGWSV
ncbi:hypothetical protein ANN_14601 [Periplaneta americana]|uniref:Per a allergen n=1 Tax=Periplaneta americana TaxID=6978 RepID=A0ABQ8SWS9_PERAM|nr:hypothetical protein ANN_14601 [Periplaneta americana]